MMRVRRERGVEVTARALRTPRAAAVAGIVFSVLFATALVLVQLAIPHDSDDPGSWVIDDAKRGSVQFGLQLLPFAGIAFLWFIGVLRDRIGPGEDRFFATVFLGSGLVFVAMFFAAGAVAAGLVDSAADTGSSDAPVWPVGREIGHTLITVYGLRMAAVFTISATTLASRLRLVPRWLVLLGYATALLLLVGAGFVPWLDLVFPAWVFVISVHILLIAFRRERDLATEPVAAG
jgi:hypothetical protein